MTAHRVTYMVERPEYMTAMDIRREMQISRASAYNLLQEMEKKGLTVRLGRSHRVSRENFELYFDRPKPKLCVFKNNRP